MSYKQILSSIINQFGYVMMRQATFESLQQQINITRREEFAQLASAAVEDSADSVVDRSDPETIYTPIFDYDGLWTDPKVIHNHDFLRDPRFIAAYRRGVQAQQKDYRYYWRVHVALWCAAHARSLPGDFVECGVWKGFLSSAIMTYLNWNTLDRRFFLFDTFDGIDEAQLTPEEIARGNLEHFRKHYRGDFHHLAEDNFSEFRNVQIVKGSVPESLRTLVIDKVCYLSLDMNNAAPEIAAATHFWDKMTPGAPILLDDYGFVSYEIQKQAFDRWAAERDVKILALPTGQGLILKPNVEP